MSTVDGWVLEGCSGAVGRNRPCVDWMDGRAPTLAIASIAVTVRQPGPASTRGGCCRDGVDDVDGQMGFGVAAVECAHVGEELPRLFWRCTCRKLRPAWS